MLLLKFSKRLNPNINPSPTPTEDFHTGRETFDGAATTLATCKLNSGIHEIAATNPSSAHEPSDTLQPANPYLNSPKKDSGTKNGPHFPKTPAASCAPTPSAHWSAPKKP